MKKLAVFLFGFATVSAVAESDFKQDVFPIIEAHCFKCHGPEKQESGLRLDSRGGMLTGGDFGPAIVPGDVEKSFLIEAITTCLLYTSDAADE